MPNSNPTPSNIIPTTLQRCQRAIDWLCEAFGFRRHLVVADGHGGMVLAKLNLGNGMIMLGSSRDDDFSQQQKPPSSPTDPVTQSAYVVVEIRDEDHDG